MGPIDERAAIEAAGERRFAWWAYGLLALFILASTGLHHLRPDILRVPSVTNVSTWKNPTFEQTLVHQRMNEAERRKILSHGATEGTDLRVILSNDLFMILVGLICFAHASRHYSRWMASCFFIGSFVFTGLEESLWVLFGRFFGGWLTIPTGGTLHGTYWFAKGGFWFIETPIVACIGWFAIAYSCVWAAGKVFPRLGLWPRAAVGGLIAMGTDLWQDPVQTSPEIMNWVWSKGDALLIFGIPLYNFAGWFLLIFVFAVFWEKLPWMERKWGRSRATLYFFSACIGGAFVIAALILAVSLYGAGGLLSILGATRTVELPPGW